MNDSNANHAVTRRDPAERIRLERLQRGLSQENMADLLNLSTTAYGDIERGKTDLTLSRLTQIAQVLTVSPLALLTDEVISAQVVDEKSAEETAHELETLRLIVEKQQVELEKTALRNRLLEAQIRRAHRDGTGQSDGC